MSAEPATSFVPPRFDAHPDAEYTLGPEVAAVCELAGYVPDVHQRLVLDRLFAYGPDDRLVSPEGCIICPRQNLKSSVLKMAALGWLYVEKVELITWSAHELPTAKEMFRDLRNLIMACPPLKARLKPSRNDGVSEANGNIAIELAPTPECPNGQRILFKARTLDGGRGLSGDRVVLDEAFALQPDHMAAILPTLSARPDAQVVYASSAGKSSSQTLRDVRDRGRGTAGHLTYLEWCSWRDPGSCKREDCPHKAGTPGCVLDDPAELVHANPSLSVWREYPGGVRVQGLAPAILQMERAAMPPQEYARERLGWWDDPIEGDPILPGDIWERSGASPGDYKPRLAVDVSPARSWACIAASGQLEDGRWAIEMTGTDEGPDYREGVSWVVPRLRALREAGALAKPLAIAAGSAAESLRPELDAAGISYELIAQRDVQAACGRFVDEATGGRLVHFRQPLLTAALVAARLQNSETGFKWARRKSAADISPLYAATVALWVAQQQDPEPKAAFWSWDDL